MTTFDDIVALDAEHVMQTYGRLPVAFVRGEGVAPLGQRGQGVPRLPRRARGHVARPRPPGGRRRDRRPGAHAAARVEPLLQRGRSPRSRRALDALLGGGGRVFFANSGAEANECAIKLARRLRAGARRARALPRALGVRLVPRPHAHHARRDRSAAEAGDVPAAARGLPPGRVRRRRRARGRDGRARRAR